MVRSGTKFSASSDSTAASVCPTLWRRLIASWTRGWNDWSESRRDGAAALFHQGTQWDNGVRLFERSWYGEHLSGRLDRTRGLWNLLALQLWAERHRRPLELGRTTRR